MLRNTIVYSLAVLVATAGCHAATEPPAPTVTGSWQRSETYQSTANSSRTITFGDDGKLAILLRNYGLYAGQTSVDLSSYDYDYGTYRVAGDSLFMTITYRTWWDRFYGDHSVVHLEDFDAPNHTPARFVVSATSLTLHTVSFPADAPLETEQTFTRVP